MDLAIPIRDGRRPVLGRIRPVGYLVEAHREDVAAHLQLHGLVVERTLEPVTVEVRDGVINGSAVTAVAVMRQAGQTMEVELEGTVDGDEARGEADAGPLGVARWTARRTGPGGAR